MTSTLSESEQKSLSDTFLVTFKDPCHDSEISPVVFSQEDYSFKLYELQAIPFSAASESKGTCGEILYEITGIDTDVYKIEGESVQAQPSDKDVWIGSFEF